MKNKWKQTREKLSSAENTSLDVRHKGRSLLLEDSKPQINSLQKEIDQNKAHTHNNKINKKTQKKLVKPSQQVTQQIKTKKMTVQKCVTTIRAEEYSKAVKLKVVQV